MTYNPADYSAVMTEAKGKSKKDLEKYYTNDKSKKHLKCIEILGLILLIGVSLLLIGTLGWIFAEEYIEEGVGKNLITLEENICQQINGTYESIILFETKSNYPDKNKIICN